MQKTPADAGIGIIAWILTAGSVLPSLPAHRVCFPSGLKGRFDTSAKTEKGIPSRFKVRSL